MMKSTSRFDFELDPQTSSFGEREGVPVRPARSMRTPDSR
jgi:hypothetical protein